MTDLEAFKQMLDHSGLKYEVDEDGQYHWCAGMGPGAPTQTVDVAKCVVVAGHFYEDLTAYFDHNEKLLTMESHVCISRDGPSSPAMREHVAITQ